MHARDPPARASVISALFYSTRLLRPPFFPRFFNSDLRALFRRTRARALVIKTEHYRPHE